MQQVSQEDIFTQFVRFISYLSAIKPLVISIDNLHWADDTSLDLFSHFGQNLPKRTLLLGTYRSESLVGEQGEPELRQAFNELRRQGASHLTLDFRSDDKEIIADFTSKFIQARFPCNTFPVGFAQHFTEHAGGNPLFMGELLNYAIQHGNIKNDDGHWDVNSGWEILDLPESLEAVVEERIQRLTEKLRDTLACASVQGHDFTAEVLARVQDQNPDSVIECLLDDLGKSHKLIDEKGEQEISSTTLLSLFQFRNSLIQQQLYKDLGATQRRRLHKKVAECLETIYGDHRLMVATQLAFHFRMARDVDKALTYEIEAAKQFSRQVAFKEAIRSYRAARDLAQARAVPADDLEYQITLELADLLKRSGNLSEAITEYLKIVDSSDSKAITRAWALNGIGDAYRMQGDMQQARPFYVKCETLATELHDKSLLVEVWSDFAHLYHRIAVESRLVSRSAEEAEGLKAAELYANKVLASAEILADWDHVRKADMVLGNLKMDCGDICAAEEFYRRAASVAAKNDLGMIAHHGLGEAQRFRGHYQEAKASYEQYLKWAIGHGIQRSEMIAYNDLGLTSAALGDFKEAKRLFEKSVAMNTPIRRRGTAIISMALLGYLGERGGNQKAALDYYVEATRLARKEDVSLLEFSDARNAAARVLVATGEYPAALMLVSGSGNEDVASSEIREECLKRLRGSEAFGKEKVREMPEQLSK